MVVPSFGSAGLPSTQSKGPLVLCAPRLPCPCLFPLESPGSVHVRKGILEVCLLGHKVTLEPQVRMPGGMGACLLLRGSNGQPALEGITYPHHCISICDVRDQPTTLAGAPVSAVCGPACEVCVYVHM